MDKSLIIACDGESASGKSTRKEPSVEIWNKEKNDYWLKIEIQKYLVIRDRWSI